jgi:hypothetical protein
VEERAGPAAAESSEEEEPARKPPKRRRLRRAAEAALVSSSSDGEAAAGGAAPPAAPPARPPPRAAALARRAPGQPNAAERIARAQAAFQAAPSEGPPGSDDSGEVELLTDEGEPSSSSAPEVDGIPGLRLKRGGGGGAAPRPGARAAAADAAAAAADAASRPPAAAPAPAAAPKKPEGAWRAEAELLLGAPDECECFSLYVEYLLLCAIDPGYEASVAASARHRAHYGRAARSVEFTLQRARAAAASEAWRSSAPGLVAAAEALPRCESEWDRSGFHASGGGSAPPSAEGGYGTDHDEATFVPCAACARSRAHATRSVVFSGRPERDGGGPGAAFRSGTGGAATAASASYAAALKKGSAAFARCGAIASPGEAEAEPDGARREEFSVGRFCAARLQLYHGLAHWRRRLRARLRRELKGELRRQRRAGAPANPAAAADALLGRESLLAELHDAFAALVEAAERYTLTGGEGWSGRRGGAWRGDMDATARGVLEALAATHDDSACEESSVDWSRECGSGAEGAEGEEAEGAEDGEQDGDEERGARAAEALPAPPRPRLAHAARQIDIRHFFGAPAVLDSD